MGAFGQTGLASWNTQQPDATSQAPASSTVVIPGSTLDLENRAAAGPQQIGQALQQQRPADQAPGQFSPENPYTPIRHQLAPIIADYTARAQATAPPEPKPGLKGFLTNFFQGAGAAMSKDVGLPTVDELHNQIVQHLGIMTQHDANIAQLQSQWEAQQAEQRYKASFEQHQANMWPSEEQAARQEVQIRGQQIPTVPVTYTPEHLKALFPLMDDATIQQNSNRVLNAADQAAISQKEALLEKANGLEKIDYGQSGKGPGRGIWYQNAITKQPQYQITPVSESGSARDLQKEQFKAQFAADHPKPNYNLMAGTDSAGNQVAGTTQELDAANVKNYVKLGQAEADKVNTARQLTSPTGLFAMANRDLAAFKPGELEGLAPRWNEFLAGKVGMSDPRYVALRTHVNGLLSTALMQAHVGARGGEKLMEHFEDIANAGKMSAPTLQAALNAEREYVEEKAMRPKTGFNPNAPAGDFFSSFGGQKR